jgi:hypothetical protein
MRTLMLHTSPMKQPEERRGLAPEIMQGVIDYYNTAPPINRLLALSTRSSLLAYFLPHTILYKQIYPLFRIISLF